MTNEERNLVISGAICGAFVAAYVHFVISDKKEKRRLAKIKTDTTAEIARIRKAGEKVSANIKAGKYDKGSINQIFEDFEFERIIADI